MAAKGTFGITVCLWSARLETRVTVQWSSIDSFWSPSGTPRCLFLIIRKSKLLLLMIQTINVRNLVIRGKIFQNPEEIFLNGKKVFIEKFLMQNVSKSKKATVIKRGRIVTQLLNAGNLLETGQFSIKPHFSLKVIKSFLTFFQKTGVPLETFWSAICLEMVTSAHFEFWRLIGHRNRQHQQ